MATIAGATAFRRTWDDPSTLKNFANFEARTSQYDYLWHWYSGTLFDQMAAWASYKGKYGLYRQIRAIHNPVERLVDFYAGSLYPGVLTEDAQRLPDGTPLAIPLAEDIDPALRSAIGQLWQWNNFQEQLAIIGTYGAALGDVAIEIVDDVASGRIEWSVRWPGVVTDLELDNRGNVQMVEMEWDYEGDNDQSYTYKKIIDRETIRTYRNGGLYEYDGQPAIQPNPYGFVPFIWIRHKNIGGDHGRPALRSSVIPKLDEVNGLASHLIDREHQLLSAPVMFGGTGVRRLGADQTKAGSTHEQTSTTAGREQLDIITAEDGGTVNTIELPEGEVLDHIRELLAGVEKDHPELTLYEQLRGMSQVTGPAAERLVGDALIPLQRARAGYDNQLVKLFQMSITIGGWRYGRRDGRWAERTRQRDVFAGFDLGSYERGDLDLSIMPRPLLPETPTERITRERLQLSLEGDRLGTTAGLFAPTIPSQATPAQVAQTAARIDGGIAE